MTGFSFGRILTATLLTACISLPAMAQAPGGQGGFGQGGGQGRFGQGGQGGQGQQFDPAQFRSQQNQQLKEELGASDEEWGVLAPKIERVQKLQADSGGGIAGVASMFGGRRMGGGGGGGGRNMMSILGGISGMSQEMQTALSNLQEAMDNPNANDQLIKERLTAVRELRAKARVELEKARQDLLELLTRRQEALLFQRGLIE